MESRKIYARQVPPEYQESPLFSFSWDDVSMPGLVVTGNRQYHSHTVPAWDTWAENWSEVADALEQIKEAPERSWYKTATEAITDLLPPTHKKRYNTREIHRWKAILADMQSCHFSEEYRPTLGALFLMTGHDWDYTTICGSSQSEWSRVYFDTTQWTKKTIQELEIEYFNEGMEWIIHEGDQPPEAPEDVEGYSFYTHCHTAEKAQEEIAAAEGVSPESVKLYEFSHWTRQAVYSKPQAEGEGMAV